MNRKAGYYIFQISWISFIMLSFSFGAYFIVTEWNFIYGTILGVVVSTIVTFAFALYVWYLVNKMDKAAKEFEDAGELIAYGLASCKRDKQVGGYLFMLKKGLYFKPYSVFHAFNEVCLTYEEISEIVDCELSRVMCIRTLGDNEEYFTVYDRQLWKEKISEMLL